MFSRLENAALALAWSQWASIGVSASGYSVPARAVDLEALIAFLPALEKRDHRLFLEAMDWCVSHASHFVSISCLKHVLRFFSTSHQRSFERVAATVNANGRTKWPARKEESLVIKLSGKSQVRLDRDVSINLRARKIFGVNARADLITVMLLASTDTEREELRWVQMSGLRDLAYSRRQLSDALRDLRMGGVVGTLEFGTTRYALRQPRPLRELLSPIPRFPGQPWAQRLALAVDLLELVPATSTKSDITRAVEVRKVVERHRPHLEAVEEAPPVVDGDREPWIAVDEWLVARLAP